MTTIISKNMLANRAFSYIQEKIQENPEISIQKLLDEAGMRFNLSPKDILELEYLLTCDKSK